jgi:hypothetical protein
MSQASEIKDYHNIKVLKYPVNRLEYCFHVGKLAEETITTIVKNILPYTEIPYHNVVVNGSDLKIYYDGKLIAKFEILNFDSRSYINSKRALSIKQNLKGVKYKGVICSFFNATSRAKEILKNIPICTIGFQLLPSKFHQYYARLNKVYRRKIANNRSLKQLKNTLKSFFCRIGLNLLMYVSRTRISISDTINLKNNNLDIDVKNIETENKRARTEEKTNSSTLRFPTVSISPSEGLISVKIRAFYNRLKILMLNLLSNLWNDRCGSVTLTNWIPLKIKIKQKSKNRKRLFRCPFRITLICPYYKQFYACLIQIIDDYISRVEKYGYNEEQIERLIDRALLRHTWKSKNQILGKCKCKAISFIDDEITSRRAYNGIAVTEPCKKMRCSQLIKSNRCEWMGLLSEHKVKTKQLKLVGFMNRDDEHG